MTFYLEIGQPDDELYGFDILNYVIMFIKGVAQWKCMKANSKLALYSIDIGNQIPFIIIVLGFSGRRLRK